MGICRDLLDMGAMLFKKTLQHIAQIGLSWV